MSRDLDLLHPEFRLMVDRWLAHCKAINLELVVTCTWRSPAEQAQLYAQGRTAPGKIVTNAKPGQSMHNVTLGGQPASVHACCAAGKSYVHLRLTLHNLPAPAAAVRGEEEAGEGGDPTQAATPPDALTRAAEAKKLEEGYVGLVGTLAKPHRVAPGG